MLMHNPSHPGELPRTWIEGADLTVTLLADHIGVTRATLSRIINGHAGVTAEMDLRLHQALGTREGLWLDLQLQRDLWVATQNKPPLIERLVIGGLRATRNRKARVPRNR
jgi:antitoxin HigA-1